MSGTRKNKADKWLPPRVYRGRSSYEYHPAEGGAIKLLKLPAEGIETESLKAEVWKAYAKQKDAPPQIDNISKLIIAFHKSAQFCTLSSKTQKDYLRYSTRIDRVFGHMVPDDVKPPHIRQFMDALAAQGKVVTANRHHSYLSVIFSWGIESAWCLENPAKQVRKFREKPRDRYIEDWEYELVIKTARASSYPYVAPMMELSYLCRARCIEVRAFTETDLSAEGIYLHRTKGSSSEVTGWSERLHNAVTEAKSLFPTAPINLKRPLVHDKKGSPINEESFKTGWNRVMKKALENGLKESFTFHDIKAKGVSDHDTKESGHRSKKMKAVYDRKPGIILPTK